MIQRPDFLLELVRRRLVERYVGSTSVVFWALLSPLLPLLVNMIIFFFVARIPEIKSMGVAGYAAFAFSGLLAFRLLQRAIAEGCDLLAGNLEMLRNANFPLPYLSVASVGSLLADLLVQLAFMAILLVWSGHGFRAAFLALPVAVTILVLMAVGISWLVSIAGYVAREMQELLTLALTMLLYLSPAVYPLDAAPPALRPLIELNPLTHVVIMFRDVMLPSGGAFVWSSWLIAASLGVSFFGLGLIAITKVKRIVGDLV